MVCSTRERVNHLIGALPGMPPDISNPPFGYVRFTRRIRLRAKRLHDVRVSPMDVAGIAHMERARGSLGVRRVNWISCAMPASSVKAVA